MGTSVEVDFAAAAPDAAATVGVAIRTLFRDNEARFSRFDPHSELSALNAARGTRVSVSPAMRDALACALDAWRRTDGIVDPRVLPVLTAHGYAGRFADGVCSVPGVAPSFARPLSEDIVLHDDGTVTLHAPVDLAGVVKGMTVAAAAAAARDAGIRGCVVDAGGDMAVVGVDADGAPWRIAIEGIDDMTFGIVDRGIATSGITRRQWTADGRRRHHLVDPRDPDRSVFDTLSVTVVATDVVTADIMAKTLFILGPDEGMTWAVVCGTRQRSGGVHAAVGRDVHGAVHP